MPAPILVGLAFILGACVGSFLNVCIHRLPEHRSVVAPRSRCPKCDAALVPMDNIPIVSWLLLRGRCRRCGERISIRYPLVELSVALVWAGAVVVQGFSWEALGAAVFLTLLLGIALTDARTYTIPDPFTLGGLMLGVALSLTPGGITVWQSLFGAVLGFTLLYFVAVVGEKVFRKPAMGGGDIKMMAMVGAFIGPAGVLLTVFLGALLGTVIFGPISLRTKKLVPFGIFLALGATVTLLWGDWIIDWYMGYALGV